LAAAGFVEPVRLRRRDNGSRRFEVRTIAPRIRQPLERARRENVIEVREDERPVGILIGALEVRKPKFGEVIGNSAWTLASYRPRLSSTRCRACWISMLWESATRLTVGRSTGSSSRYIGRTSMPPSCNLSEG